MGFVLTVRGHQFHEPLAERMNVGISDKKISSRYLPYFFQKGSRVG